MMKDNIILRAAIQTIVAFLLTMAVCAIIGLVCGGCSRKVYVPVENAITRTDTLYQSRLRVDSVIMRDSVAVIQRGDTVYYTKYRDRIHVKERADTVYQTVIDSVRISVPYPVERELTRWEKTKMETGGWAMGAGAALLVAVIALAVWLIKIKRRR